MHLAAQPMKIRARHANGRGGVVEIPLAVESLGIRGDLTAGGGDDFDLTRDDFAEVVSNFTGGSPVPVYFGHIADDERRTVPSAGFVEDVWLEDGTLWGAIDLGPEAWDAVVNKRGFRGFSVEIEKDLETPTRSHNGWVLTGGALTNTPALDVQYVAAAIEAAASSGTRVRLTTALNVEREEDSSVSDTKQLEALQTDVKRLEADLAKSEAEKNDLKAQLAGKNDETSKLSKQVETLTDRVGKLVEESEANKARALEAEIRQTVKDAIDNGIAPALFEGYSDAESKTGWVNDNWGTFDAFKRVLERVPRLSMGTKTSAGKKEEKSEESAIAEWNADVRKLATEEKCSIAQANKLMRERDPQRFQAVMAERERVA